MQHIRLSSYFPAAYKSEVIHYDKHKKKSDKSSHRDFERVKSHILRYPTSSSLPLRFIAYQ